MKWNHALDKTLRDYGVSAKWLSTETGISETMISQFRKGRKDTTTDTLDRLLEPLPFDAKQMFFSLVLGRHLPSAQCPTLEDQLRDLSKKKKKETIMNLVEAIAKDSSDEPSEETSEKRSLQKVH